jgi:extradiol dioxygenase family protein
MKKVMTAVAFLGSLAAFAAPISPMDNYTTSDHTEAELKIFWNKVRSLENQFKGKDCFKRANIWSYTLNKNYKVYSKKVFMHYTDKFNYEIDDMGRTGVNARLGRVFSSNKGWDFHVAPAVTINGVDYVLDPHLRKAPEKTEDWVEFLTERGEHRLKIRHRELLDDLAKARKRLARSLSEKSGTYVEIAENRAKVKEIEEKLKYLGLTENPNQKIDIKCKKITHIMEYDGNQFTEWCYYQETSMYYYGPLQLRLLNYGDIPRDLRLPVTDSNYYTDTYFAEGRNYVYRDFDLGQLEESLSEFKPANKPASLYEL